MKFTRAADDESQAEADQLRSKALAAHVKALPEGYYYSPRILGTFAGIGLSLLATYFAFTVGAAIIVYIDQDIGPTPNRSLFSIVWTMCSPISILLFGRLSDRFGRRAFVLGANLLGIIGGIVACTARTMNVLIGANVLLGLASGPPASYPLLTGELSPNKAKFLGTVMVVIPNIIATGFGPYLGLRLVHLASWRWVFYIYILMIVPGTACFYFFYHPPSFVQLHGTAPRRMDELKKTDFVGVFLLVAGLALFLLGVSWGGQPLAWNSATILGLLISGAACLVAFTLYECLVPLQRPIIPMAFFKDLRGFTCINVISAVTGCVNTSLQIIWPSQVTYIFGTTATSWEQVGWLTTTITFGSWAGIVFFGSFYHVIKHIRLQLLFGMIFMTAFVGAMASINRHVLGRAVAFSFLGTLPVGWGEVITMLLVQYVASDADLGVAFAVTSANRTILGSVFTAIFSAIVSNKLPQELETIAIPAILDAGLPKSSLSTLSTAITSGSQAALQAVPGMTDQILEVTNDTVSASYAAAYAYVYYTAIALGGVTIIAAMLIRDFDPYLNDHVSRQIYRKAETVKDVLEVDHPERGSSDASGKYEASSEKSPNPVIEEPEV